MSLANLWKKLHAARFRPPPPMLHMRLSYDELQKERRPVQRRTENLCAYAVRLQMTHDEWHAFLQNFRLMRLSVLIPAHDRRTCGLCKHALEVLRKHGIEPDLDQVTAIPAPNIGGVR